MLKQGIGILSGKWGTGKTFVAVDLAKSVGLSEYFAGQKVVDNCGVVYIASERPHAIPRRLKIARGSDESAPVYVARNCPRLTEPETGDKLVKAVRAISDEMEQRHDLKVGLVIIDTLMTAAGWESENSNAEVQQVIATMRHLSDLTNTFVLAVDHHGKDSSKGTRGASDKESSTDLVLHLGTGSMKIQKCSDGRQGDVIPFTLYVHELGLDEDGDMITDCTVEWSGPVVAKSKALSAAIEAAEKSEINLRGRTVNAPTKGDVRKLFYSALGDKKSEAKKKAFQRALKDCQNIIVEMEYKEDLYLVPSGQDDTQ